LVNDDDGEIDYTLGENAKGYKLSVMKSKRPDIPISVSDEVKAL